MYTYMYLHICVNTSYLHETENVLKRKYTMVTCRSNSLWCNKVVSTLGWQSHANDFRILPSYSNHKVEIRKDKTQSTPWLSKEWREYLRSLKQSQTYIDHHRSSSVLRCTLLLRLRIVITCEGPRSGIFKTASIATCWFLQLQAVSWEVWNGLYINNITLH